MAKPNYSFEKRQRDIAKKRKKDEKRLRKQNASETPGLPPAAGPDEAAAAPETHQPET